ncbi:MAG: MFS transporter [Acidobacteria bacterium]|nr:MFS transporter [Acidobacteriota bacterium]
MLLAVYRLWRHFRGRRRGRGRGGAGLSPRPFNFARGRRALFTFATPTARLMAAPRTQPEPPPPARARGMFRALKHRNFRLFLAGAFLSNAGTWMQTVAQSWLVLQLTDSGTWLGVDTFVATAPGLALTLVGGVIADKLDRKRLLIYTQALCGLSALVLAFLIWAEVIQWKGEARRPSDVWMVLVLTFVTGCCWALSGPSYQAITFDLVGREDVANAVALNSSQFQLARVVGPLLAAVTMSLLGMTGAGGDEAEARAADAGAPAVAEASKTVAGRRSMWGDVVEAFGYVRGRPRVRVVLLCSTVVGLFGAPYLVLMPLFARNVYGWDEAGLSLMMGTAGAGALVGALTLAYLGDLRRKGLLLLGSLFSAGACITALGAASPAAAVPLLFVTGMSVVCLFALGNTLLQQLVRDEMRGRVMSMWILTFIGTMPVGSVLSGAASDRFGPRPVLSACGIVILVFGLAVASRNPSLREM